MKPDLVVQHTYNAPVEVLFDAWLSADALERFMCPAPGTTVDEASATPEVGGAFRVVMRVGDQQLPHEGEYLDIERPTRLRFAWRSPAAGADSEVEITFTVLPGGGTELTLKQFNLPTAHAIEAHTGGWTHILSTLEDNHG